ncbi:MAG: PstS family phosphate ABC transporter substrate-binding protein [Pseudomonadota bacterium]
MLALALLPPFASAQSGRDYVYIVGSSTVYPFATVVAERFGRGHPYRTPKVESTGSGGGFKLFCDGIGVDYPDISNSSRAIKATELAACRSNGVVDIIELKIGYDGIVFANALSAPDVMFKSADVYQALAKRVPGPEPGMLVPNPNRRWSDIRGELPDMRIEVLGPPPTSGTRDEFVEMAMGDGCRQVPWIAALETTEPARFRAICHTIREDGAFVETGENDNLIVQKLEANPRAFGIFGFSFLDQNTDKVKGAGIDGVRPGFEVIADGRYPVSRPLYFYVKKDHVATIPGLKAFLAELTSERTLGDDGYLVDRGLIPMPLTERELAAADATELTSLSVARD